MNNEKKFTIPEERFTALEQKLSMLVESIEERLEQKTAKLREDILVRLTPPENEREFLTRQETANLLGISLPTLRSWTRKGLIPSHRISSRIRYKKGDVVNSLQFVKIPKSNQQ